jgi:hypothetical protein
MVSYLTANDWSFSSVEAVCYLDQKDSGASCSYWSKDVVAGLDLVAGCTTLNGPAHCHEILLVCELGRQAAVNGLSKGTSKRLKSATLRVTTVR